MQWYYAQGDDQIGPIDDHAFHDLVRAGTVTPETPVWREGMATWLPYGQVSGKRQSTEPRKRLSLAKTPSGAPAGTGAQEPSEAAGDTPESEGALPAPPNFVGGETNVTTLVEPLFRAKGWIRLAGIMSLIGGILSAIGPGIVIAWLPIWIGLLLIGTSKLLAQAYEADDDIAMIGAMDKLRLVFKIYGIMTLIGLVLAAGIGILAALVIPAMMVGRMH